MAEGYSPAATPAANSVPQNFESALDELERIVQSMELGSLTLEQSLAAHRRGIELAKYCQAVLAQAQAEVRVLENESLKALPSADAEG